MAILSVILIVLFSVLLVLVFLFGFSFIKYQIIYRINKGRYRKLKPKIDFLAEPPTINGQIDDNLFFLPIRKFRTRIRTNPLSRPIDVTYCLAYGVDFFYIYIEVKASEITYRDRGFQNGDGFHMVLAQPKPDHQLTDEFYVFGFSPRKDGGADKFIWYHDVGLSFKSLGEEVQFAVNQFDDKVGFELLLPWKEVHPYHPWVSKTLGFNLSFVKATGSSFLQYHTVLSDWRMQAENQRRNYALITFQEPDSSIKQDMQFVVVDKTSQSGREIACNIATLARASSEQSVEFTLTAKDKTREEYKQSFSYKNIEGLEITKIGIPTEEMAPGTYTVNYKTPLTSETTELTILPTINYDSLVSRINACKELASGSKTTIQFMLDQIQVRINQAKAYEPNPELLESILEIQEIIKQAEEGIDILKEKKGIFRRAFESEIDNTLQPYSIEVPETYDDSKEYPLIVFLHGSGRDDRGALNFLDFVEGEFIKIAPRARGTSHYFAPEEALIDVKEAMEDSLANYNIAKEKIVLTGFSMGGYGVYRMIKEHSYFKGLAIFSGQPKVPFYIRWFTKGKFVNFLKKKEVEKFREIPMFIYHGREDKNCSYDRTAKFVESLKNEGGTVEFIDDERGHDKPEEGVQERFNEWIKDFL